MPALVKKHRDVLGLDIGVSSVKLVWLRKNNDVIEPRGAVVKALPDIEAGNLFTDSSSMAELIKSAVNEIKCTAKKAFICLNGPGVYTRRLSIVSMPEQEMRDAVKWALKDQIPMDLSSTVMDYKAIGQTTDEQGASQTHLLVAAAEKEKVNDCIEAVEAAGLIPAGVSVNPFVLAAFFQTAGSGGVNVIVDAGSQKLELIWFKDGLPQFSRLLPGAGVKFTKAMASTFATGRGKIELTYEEAELLKKEIGIPSYEPGQPDSIVGNGIPVLQLSALLRPVIEKLVGEIKRSFDYCKSQFGLPLPQKIYLTGGGSLLKNFNSVLSKELNLEVAGLEVFRRGITLSGGDSVYFDIALATAFQEARGINLLPMEYKLKNKRMALISSLRLVVVAIALGFFTSYFFTLAEVDALKKQVKIANDNYNALREVDTISNDIDKKKAILAQLPLGSARATAALKVISAAVPPEVELDGLTYEISSDITLRGIAVSAQPEEALVGFIKTLRDSGLFREVKIVSLHKNISYEGLAAGESGISKFSIACKPAAGLEGK